MVFKVPVFLTGLTLAVVLDERSPSGAGLGWFLVGLSSVVIFALALCFWTFLRIKNRRIRLLRRQLAELREIHNDSLRRLDLVQKHATQYMLSLSADSHRAYSIAGEIVNALGEMVEKLECYIEIRDFTALLEAEEILNGEFALKVNALEEDTPQGEAIYSKEGWDAKLNELFEVIAADIAVASNKADALRARKRSRRITIDDLIEAGVRFVNEKGKRLSAKWKSPFNHPPSR